MTCKVGTAGTDEKEPPHTRPTLHPALELKGQDLLKKAQKMWYPHFTSIKTKGLVQPPANWSHPEPRIVFSNVENKTKSPTLEDFFSEGHYTALLYNVQRSQAEQNSKTR